jgi:glycosyltransferase involved in cell wall biosynthesis
MNRSARPRSLAGATILQLVPALADDTIANAAVDIARTLVQSGARAIVAGDGGPLVSELHTFGAEWVPMDLASYNPFRLHANAAKLARLIAAERVDIVHAHHAAAAWSARKATDKQPVFLVTSFDDRLPADRWPMTQLRRSLALGARVIAPSSYVSLSMMARYRIPAERITVIPRAIDTDAFNPAAISGDRIAALRRVWGVLPEMRVVVVAGGRIAPWNGQMTALEAARLIAANRRDVNFIFIGDDQAQPRYAASLRRRARTHAIDTLCRFVGHCPDMPAAFAVADVVVVPALRPPLSGRLAAQAQAVGRAVVTTAVGMLPENVLAPPRMRDELRTGWVVRPGRPGELAQAVNAALALDRTAADALGARAREFAEFVFSPHSVAAAIRDVYTSLLSRDR